MNAEDSSGRTPEARAATYRKKAWCPLHLKNSMRFGSMSDSSRSLGMTEFSSVARGCKVPQKVAEEFSTVGG
jgi:hypothetical protein